MCDLVDERRSSRRSVAPADPAAAGGAGRRAWARRAVRHRARVLPVPGDLRGGGGQGLARPAPARVDHRGLPAAADLARGVRHPPHPQRDARRWHPRRILQGRSGTRPTRDQRHLRTRRRGRRSPRRVQERRQGDRRPVRALGVVHGQVVDGRGRLVVPHPRQRVGRSVGRRPPWGTRRRRRASPTWRSLRGRPAPRRPPARVDVGAVRQLLPPLRARFVGPHGRGVGHRQPDVRLPRRGQRRRAASRVPASPGPTPTPIWPWPPSSPPGSGASSTALELPAPFEGNAYDAPDVARRADHPGGGHRRARSERRGRHVCALFGNGIGATHFGYFWNSVAWPASLFLFSLSVWVGLAAAGRERAQGNELRLRHSRASPPAWRC